MSENTTIQKDILTDEQRLEKLELAEKLIREVEFSYQYGTNIRSSIYREVIAMFGMNSFTGNLTCRLRNEVRYKIGVKL